MFVLMCCVLVCLQLALIKVKSAAVAVMSSVFTPHSQAANHQLAGLARSTNTHTHTHRHTHTFSMYIDFHNCSHPLNLFMFCSFITSNFLVFSCYGPPQHGAYL
ncbi:hypothetical protein GOODEAATRI_006053 [Goodea atripinnis]|uniref:Secreted protein n=1 Tax=Goodea atripinnis TaxID=208336 RepID=A0ABV0PBP8_9TELE